MRNTETRYDPTKLGRVVTSLLENMRFDFSSYSQNINSIVLEAMIANHNMICSKYPNCFCSELDVRLTLKCCNEIFLEIYESFNEIKIKFKLQISITDHCTLLFFQERENSSWECKIGEKTKRDWLMNLINDLLTKERKEIRAVKGRRTTISTNLDFLHANFLIEISQSRVLAIMNLDKLGTSKNLAIHEQMYVHRLRRLLESTFPQ